MHTHGWHLGSLHAWCDEGAIPAQPWGLQKSYKHLKANFTETKFLWWKVGPGKSACSYIFEKKPYGNSQEISFLHSQHKEFLKENISHLFSRKVEILILKLLSKQQNVKKVRSIKKLQQEKSFNPLSERYWHPLQVEFCLYCHWLQREMRVLLVITAGAGYSAEESPSPWYFQQLSILIIKLHFTDGESFLVPFPLFNRWQKDLLKIRKILATAKIDVHPLNSCPVSWLKEMDVILPSVLWNTQLSTAYISLAAACFSDIWRSTYLNFSSQHGWELLGDGGKKMANRTRMFIFAILNKQPAARTVFQKGTSSVAVSVNLKNI